MLPSGNWTGCYGKNIANTVGRTSLNWQFHGYVKLPQGSYIIKQELIHKELKTHIWFNGHFRHLNWRYYRSCTTKFGGIYTIPFSMNIDGRYLQFMWLEWPLTVWKLDIWYTSWIYPHCWRPNAPKPCPPSDVSWFMLPHLTWTYHDISTKHPRCLA